MTDPTVKDKDGISAAVTMAHMADYVAKQGHTLLHTLESLYHQYALFVVDPLYLHIYLLIFWGGGDVQVRLLCQQQFVFYLPQPQDDRSNL